MNEYPKIKILLFMIVCFMITASLSAEVFVNWKAGYFIEYPEDWYRVPYGTVNYFLSTQNVSILEFEYEAVISQKTEKPFFFEPYMFLSQQSTEQLSDSQIDSVLENISNTYNSRYMKASIWPGEKKFGLNKPIYDESLKMLLIKSRVTSENIDKILLEIWKFYEKGVAVFLCFSPKEKYNEAKPVFLKIVSSFSTQNLEKAAPKEDFKIVDLSTREATKYDKNDFPKPGSETIESSGSGKTWLCVILGVIVLLIVGYIIGKLKSR